MVNNVMSLTGNGLLDWIYQRVSAVVLAGYSLFLLTYFVHSPTHTYTAWRSLYQCQLMKIATLFTLIALLVHAWIGMWTVSTDYLKCTCLRLSFQLIMIFSLLATLIWGAMIVWSV